MTTLRPALHSDGSGRKIVEVHDEDGTLLGCLYPSPRGFKFISKYRITCGNADRPVEMPGFEFICMVKPEEGR